MTEHTSAPQEQPAAAPTPQATPEPTSKKSGFGKRLGGAVATIAIILAGKFGFAAFQDRDNKAKDAAKAVTAFLEAETEADASAHMVEQSKFKVAPNCSVLAELSDDAEFSVDSSTKESETAASVKVEFKSGEHITAHATKVGGTWRVDSINCA